MLRPHLQSANICYSMQKRQLFKIDYVCKILGGGEVESRVIFGRGSIRQKLAFLESGTLISFNEMKKWKLFLDLW